MKRAYFTNEVTEDIEVTECTLRTSLCLSANVSYTGLVYRRIGSKKSIYLIAALDEWLDNLAWGDQP